MWFKRRNIWGFLNSQLGLWLCSAVVLTGITAQYTSYQAEQTRQREVATREAAAKKDRDEKIDQIDFELAFRYAVLLRELAKLNETQKELSVRQQGEQSSDYAAKIDAKIGSIFGRFAKDHTSLYAQFKEMSMLVLHAELYRLLDASERKAFESYIAVIAGDPFDKTDRSNAYAVARIVQLDLVAPRWRNKHRHFKYLDCVTLDSAGKEYPRASYDPFC